MPTVIRPMQAEDAAEVLEVHRAAIHGTAAADYPQDILNDWGEYPITRGAVERFSSNPDREIRLVAELDGKIVGFGALVIANAELRACYVAPEAARHRVGTAIVDEIEHIAHDHGLSRLKLNSSLTAERFYATLGYKT